MIYRVKKVIMYNDATLTESPRIQTIIWPTVLEIGGLYFLRPGELYRVIREEANV